MIWTGFLLGFLGSFHCIGMCGPIALAVSTKDQNRFLKNKLLYNFGRTLTYALLGLVIGSLGFSLALAGAQQWVSILTGAMILLMAIFYKRSEKWVASSGVFGLVNNLKSVLGKNIQKGGSQAFLMTGILNGFLPCGMVYLALVASMALQNPWLGSFYMLLFGLGTIPTLLMVMLSGKVLPINIRNRMTKALPYFAMFIGILFMVRGMGLGIHYISPKIDGLAKGDPTEITQCD